MLEAAADLVGREALEQVLPTGTAAQGLEDATYHLARVTLWVTTTIRLAWQLRDHAEMRCPYRGTALKQFYLAELDYGSKKQTL
jgi:hypothetical protein